MSYFYRPVLALVLLAIGAQFLLASAPAHAQWIPPKGEGSPTLEYQRFDTSTIFFSDIGRVRFSIDDSLEDTIVEGNILVLSVDYGLWDRLGST